MQKLTQKGRVGIKETEEALKIAIPVPRHLALMSLTILFLALWFFCGCFVVWQFVDTGGLESVFHLFWLVGWSVGMAYMGLILLWMLTGEERIVITDSELRIVLRLPWFGWTRKYRLDWIKEVGVNTERTPMMDPWLNLEAWGVVGKSLRIRYGYSDVRFGVRLDDSEKTLVAAEINRRLGKLPAEENVRPPGTAPT